MYHFSYFKESDQQALLDFIEAYPLAFLTGSSHGFPVATQIPMLLDIRDDGWYLQGHIMRKTDHHKAFIENPQVLAVFTGPNSYVSATWYTQPQMGSTWNYMSVHMQGTLRFMEDEELVAFMKKFTLKFEQGDNHSPTIYNNLPDDYLRKMMPAIVGVEMKVEKLDNVFKLSQNRDERSYQQIISKLEEKGGFGALLAAEMSKRKEALFPAGKEWNADAFSS